MLDFDEPRQQDGFDDEGDDGFDEYGTAGEPGQKVSAATSKGRWEQNTIESLNQAKALTKHALQSLLDNETTHGRTKRQLHANKITVSHTIKKKMGVTEDLIKALDDRMESMDDTMRQVGECLFQLQRAFRSKWSVLNVCERRLQLRDARPQQELVRDACQEALEQERTTLIESRQELAEQADSMKEMLITLDKMKTELHEDMQHKRHGLRIDRSCLDPKKPMSARPGQHDRLVLPSVQEAVHYGGPPSPKSMEPGTGQQHEEERQGNTKELIVKAVRCEEDAIRLCNESDAAMIHTKRECSRASASAQAAMAQRIEETLSFKKKLEAQIRETDEALAKSEVSLAKTKKKIEAHDKPLRALETQFSLRTARTDREDIRDPVQDELEGHLGTVKSNLKALTDKWHATRDIIDQLRATKQRLQEDHRCKSAAQKIDDACVRVTPKKAIELDRMDPRGGRCREPHSARRKQRVAGGYEPLMATTFS